MNIFNCQKRMVPALILMMFMALVCPPLPAKERRGSTVEVTMTDRSRVKGELLAVKSDVLLVYDRDARQGRSIDLRQVAQVKVLKKSKALLGMAIGLGIGLVIGSNPEKNVHIESYWSKTIIKFGLIGGILGAFSGIPEKFSLDVFRTRQENLEQLKRYAREQYFEKPAVEKKIVSTSR